MSANFTIAFSLALTDVMGNAWGNGNSAWTDALQYPHGDYEIFIPTTSGNVLMDINFIWQMYSVPDTISSAIIPGLSIGTSEATFQGTGALTFGPYNFGVSLRANMPPGVGHPGYYTDIGVAPGTFNFIMSCVNGKIRLSIGGVGLVYPSAHFGGDTSIMADLGSAVLVGFPSHGLISGGGGPDGAHGGPGPTTHYFLETAYGGSDWWTDRILCTEFFTA